MTGRQDAPPLPLSGRRWTIDAARTSGGRMVESREADATERDEIVKALGLLACDSLRLSVTLKPAGRKRFHLEGRLEAAIVQACVVTLDPVAATIDEEITLELWPEDEIGAEPDAIAVTDANAEERPEPIKDGSIDLGRITYETLAAAIDPYPRTPDATFEPLQEIAPGDHPFAKLKRLKRDE